MKSLFKAALILSGLVVVVVIALVITVATLDPNDHKDWISKKALEMTGRTLVLDGDIDATFYPWLGIEANNVTLGNAAGFGDEAFLYADYLKLRIKLMPMLKEQYEVDTVSIRGAVINLARNEKGVSNWDDLMTEKKDEGSFPLAAVVLGGVDVQKASLNWHDLASDTVYKISNMDIKTDALRYGEPLKLSVDMDFIANKPALNGIINLAGTITYDIDNQIYAIKPLELQAKLKGKNIPEGENDVKLSAVIDLDLDKDTATISDLTIQGLGTQLSGNLNASRIQTTGPSIQASLKGDGTDLAQLFKIAEIEPLASQIAELSARSFTIDTTLDADLERGDINVSHLALAMLGATVNGEVKARNIFSETPGYKGQLKAAGPDLPTLLEVLGQLQGGSESA
ncbi:MAG: AsmA protein, partial [Gammaproteobacteria bacterium]